MPNSVLEKKISTEFMEEEDLELFLSWNKIKSLEGKSSTSADQSFTVPTLIDSANRVRTEVIINGLEKEGIEKIFRKISYNTQRTKELTRAISINSEYLYQELSLLNNIYTLEKKIEIYHFFKNNLQFFSLVIRAHKEIKKYFSSEELILDIISDPEFNEEPKLAIFICTNLPPYEAFEKLNMLDENWWLDASIEADGKINIYIEFK